MKTKQEDHRIIETSVKKTSFFSGKGKCDVRNNFFCLFWRSRIQNRTEEGTSWFSSSLKPHLETFTL